MPEDSPIRTSRMVGSHEYGHYVFCSMLNETDSSAVGYLIKSQIFVGEDQRRPFRWVNEAVADWFTGQVVGGADYGWATSPGFTGEQLRSTRVSWNAVVLGF